MEQLPHSAFGLESSVLDPLDKAHHSEAVARVSRLVFRAACMWAVLVSGSVIIGWILNNALLVHFPSNRGWGTMMPLTAISFVLIAVGLWLLSPDRPIAKQRRWLGLLLAVIPTVIGAVFMIEYATGVDTGMEAWLFQGAVTAMLGNLNGRPSVASCLAMIMLGLGVLTLNTRSARVRRTAEIGVFIVLILAMERLIGYLFSEQGVFAPDWQLFGVPVLFPMSPKAATCALALVVGVLYARPTRGLVGLSFSAGPGGFLVRWLLPLAIIVPIAFGWLGLLSIRAGVRGNEYPLSVVVNAMIALLVCVVSINARAIQRLDSQRARAAGALAERERILRALFDNAGAGMFLVGVKGAPVTVNATLETMLGYTATELGQMRFEQFMDPKDARVSYELIMQLVHGTRDEYRIEKRYIRKDGTRFWGQLTTSLARDHDGRPEFIVGLIEDVTERKEAEEAQRRLTQILDETPDFVGIADLQGRAIYVNRAGRDLIGVGDEDITGLSIPDFHPPAAAERVMKIAVPLAIRNGVWKGENELLGPQGERIPVSQVVLSHGKSNGDVAHLSTIVRDITEQKQFEASQEFLLEASRLFSGSLETEAILRSLVALLVPMHADVCVIDLLNDDGSITSAAIARVEKNDAQEITVQMRVYPAGKKANRIIRDVVSSARPMIVPAVTSEWLDRLAVDGRHSSLFRKLKARSLMAVPLPSRPQVKGVIWYTGTTSSRHYRPRDLALAQEVAASVSLALSNAALMKQSRDATRMRDEVLRVVAHDLRSPLNTISLSASLLGQQGMQPGQEAGKDRLAVIERSVAQADRLIQDLLDVARVEAGELQIEPEPVDVRAVIAETVELHQPLAAQRKIEVRAEPVSAGLVIQADRRRLLQVFANLLGNAFKFSSEGGTVTLRVDKQNGAVCFSVQDQGQGINKSDLPRLFEPFWQGSKHKERGAGLGLSISKAIVQAHGGKIWVESQPGVGSTFYFTLPIGAAQAGSESMAAD